MARFCERKTNKSEKSKGKSTVKMPPIGCNMKNKLTKVNDINFIIPSKKNMSTKL